LADPKKEARLFIEIGRRRGAIDDTKIARAREHAQETGLPLAEAFSELKLVTPDEAEKIRRALVDLEFTCVSCEKKDWREPEEERKKGRLCSDCLSGKTSDVKAVEPLSAPAPAKARPVVVAPTNEVLPGTVLGQCRIEGRLGQGRTGIVYRAHHEGMGRPVAVKVLDPRLLSNKGFVEQFFAEAGALTKLDHPNVARVFSFDTNESGYHFVVMELVEGGTLESLWKTRGNRLPLEDAVKLTKEAAQGLEHAHEAKLLHRDVKPGNLLLTRDGHIKVADFGIAARTEGEVFFASELAGTPAYTAPEVAEGARLDGRADQYALGATLFQLVTGEPPYPGERAHEVLLRQVNEPTPHAAERVDGIPSWLDQLLQRMLAKKPEDRFASMADVVKALETRSAQAPSEGAGRTKISAQEILALEKGARAGAVAAPSWVPAVLAIAACIAIGVGFFLVPGHDAFGGANLELGKTPGYVRKLAAETKAKAASGSPQDVSLAITKLDHAIKDLGPQVDTAPLKELKETLEKQAQGLAQGRESDLSKKAQSLVQDRRWGALFDLADPENAEIVTLGLKEKALAWRDQARKGLAEQGEVYVPQGPYLAGPTGTSTVLKGFYLDITEVTNEAWLEGIEKGQLERPSTWPPGALQESEKKKPVTGVTFEQAQKFAAWKKKRLPTSAEWEKAARGTKDARAFPWGDRFEPGRANLLEGGSGALEDVTARPKDESPFGVLGMAGNALEWVQAPEGPLVAGGSFRSNALSARVFSRFKEDGKDVAVGLRCARDLE
jgi:serine/threonine-protein kinase